MISFQRTLLDSIVTLGVCVCVCVCVCLKDSAVCVVPVVPQLTLLTCCELLIPVVSGSPCMSVLNTETYSYCVIVSV